MEKFLYQRIEKKDTKINVQFMYPAIESFAMASLGYLSIFKMLDLEPSIFVERVYSDSNTTYLPPKNADAIGFSVSFELDILTLIKMLKKYDIPLKASDRKENDPFIFAGGPVLMSNPIPYEAFFDFILIGEMVSIIPALKKIEEGKENKLSKDEILKNLSEVRGVYVPKYKKEKVEITRDNIEFNPCYTPILSDKSFFKDTFIVEIERGCPKMCNFCLASWLNLPVRFVNYEKIIETIDLGLKYTNKIALLGAGVSLHPDFDKIMDYISKIAQNRELELSISSLRSNSIDINLIKTLVKCGQKTATIAIEAASQKLRDIINKDLSEDEIINTVKIAQLGGLKGLKIYSMIGLVSEDDSDIEEFIVLAKKLKEIIKQGIKEGLNNLDLTFSFSTFIPKSQTPFEKAKRCDKKTLEKRINYLKKNLAPLGINTRFSSIEWDMVQSILSRYDKDLSDFLIEVSLQGGNLGAFKQLWRKYSRKEYLIPFENSVRYPLDNIKAPKWDFVDTSCNSLKEKIKSTLEPYLID